MKSGVCCFVMLNGMKHLANKKKIFRSAYRYWESVFNPSFNYGEFAIIKSQAGLNNYKLSVKEWVEKTNSIGLKATAGRDSGTYRCY